jgi:hypothetical protein
MSWLDFVESYSVGEEPIDKPTLDELRAFLRQFAYGTGADPEMSHVQADKALLAYIGDPEVMRLFADMEKWYA